MDIITWESDKHIQINDLNPDDLKNDPSFWRDIQNKYAGYEIDFCYHNCEIPVEFIAEIGAALLESCVETRLVQQNFTPICRFEPTLVTNDNLSTFKALHDKANPGMFWTSEKISQDLSRWNIYMCEDSYVMMSLWSDVSEIFALEATNETTGAALLSAAAKFAFETVKTGVLFMIDDDAIIHAKAAQSIGFVECGKYIAYRGIVKNA